MTDIKTLKKGDFLFKESEKAIHFYLIQSGRLQLGWFKSNKFIELQTITGPSIIADYTLANQNSHLFSALALSEVKFINFPSEQIKPQLDSLPQTIKLLIKSQFDRQKLWLLEIKNLKFEQNQVPCPEDKIPKLFASLYFGVKNKSTLQKIKDKTVHVLTQWPNVKLYIHKVFDESPKRLDNILLILKKLNQVDLIYESPEENPEAPEILQKVHFFNLDFLDWFIEFYQHYYFKPEKSHVLKYEDFIFKLVKIMVELGLEKTVNHKGYVQISLAQLNEQIKIQLNATLSPDHQSRLEAKGFFLKRISQGADSYLEFDLKEYQNILLTWSIIKEIDQWNQYGFINLNDTSSTNQNTSLTTNTCPQCHGKIETQHKFCPHCGFKLSL